MAFMTEGFTEGIRQQLATTTGLDPRHWWGQVDGGSSTSSSLNLIRRGKRQVLQEGSSQACR